MKHLFRHIAALILMASFFSCSTTKVLSENESRLSQNRIKVVNDKKFNVNKIQPYLKQKPNGSFIFGWNPFISIYNWQNGKGKAWDKIVTKVGVAPVVYEPDLVESSVENLRKHLEYLGYYGSKIDTEVKIHKQKAKVDYIIELGKRFPIEKIEFDIPAGELYPDFYADTANIEVKAGDYLSEASLEAESARSGQHLRDRGFYGFNKNYYFFEADTNSVSNAAILTYRINEYTRNETASQAKPFRKFHINSVKVSYPKSLKIRHKVIDELNTIIPGRQYSETDINTTYSRLSALRIFSGINIEVNERDSNSVDCVINLNKSKLQGFKLNLEASINSGGLFGVSPGLSYYHKNIFRGGEWLNLSFMGNFQFKFNDSVRSDEFGVSAGLSFPEFLGLPNRVFKGAVIPRTDVSLSYNYQSRPEYTRNIISTSYGYNGSYAGKLFYQVYPLQLSIVRLVDLDAAFYDSLANDPFMRNAYQNHFDLGLGSSLYYTTDASVNPKSSYFYTRFLFDISGNLLSAFNSLMKKDESGAGMIWNTPYSQYVRAELTLGKTWKFGRKDGQAIATRLQAGAGYAYGNSTALPFEKHFYSGGANSLRGWQARTVGPGLSKRDMSFVIPNQTGDVKLEANIEYRFNIVWKIAGALFVDAGNIWSLRETSNEQYSSLLTGSNFFNSIAMNWGAGLRVDLDFLVLRIDLGLKLHDPARDAKWLTPREWFQRDGYAFHFGVGYPF